MKILKLITFFTIFLSQATLANLVLRIDDPDSSSYIQMTIQGAGSSDFIFENSSYILPGDFNYFDGISLHSNDSLMSNNSTWEWTEDWGDIGLYGDPQNSFGFSTNDLSGLASWADLSGQNIDGHNYYTYLSGQSFEIKMNAGQPDASSSAWVISVDPTAVPLPAGIYLFLSGLVGLGLMRGRNG